MDLSRAELVRVEHVVKNPCATACLKLRFLSAANRIQ